MKAVVDTSVWSAYLRRSSPPETLRRVVERFVRCNQVHLLGIVRQELLSGVSHPQQFEKLSRALSGFPDEPATAMTIRLQQNSTICAGPTAYKVVRSIS
jgi:predicted nucleic acid-binding protein